jgi:hypothetical protein
MFLSRLDLFGTSRRPAARLSGWFVAGALMVISGPLSAADPCQGRHVRHLGGAHAVDPRPLADLADLQRRLPQLEAGMRAMIAQDPSIGAGAADALVAAIRSGNGVSERELGRAEAMEWMVYQPEKGRLDRIAPPCVELDRDYAAFEITVEVADAKPAAAVAARCELVVTRNCEHENPTLTLDLAGSSAGARVEHNGHAVNGQGTRFSLADDAPCSQDQSFVVRAQDAGAPAHTARVYRFLIPKACSNLAFLGEAPARQIAAASAPTTCEKTVTAPQCQPWAELAVDPTSVEVHHPAAVRARPGWSDCSASLTASCSGQGTPIEISPTGEATYTPARTCCGEAGWDLRLEARNVAGQAAQATAILGVEPHAWTLRPSLVYYSPRDGEQARNIDLPFGQSGRESYEVDSGFGVGVALEKRLDPRWGVEGAAIFGRTETTYELTTGGQTGEDDHAANFFAFTVGPNLHLLRCRAADLYVGLFAGYGGLADPNYWVFGHHFHADLSGEFIWGAQIGVDVPFKPESDWGFHAGLRYFGNEQETDAGSFDVDPLLVEAGLSYRF